MFSYLAHRKACREKQRERTERIRALPARYHEPLTAADTQILSLPASTLISLVQHSQLEPSAALLAYGKKALAAHAATNCLTEVMIGEAEGWAERCRRDGPLAGMPVSMKDTVAVAGYDSCMGYSAYVGKPMEKHSPLVRLLLDAGAVPFVKTNVPVTLLSLESSNDVFGTTTNAHKKAYTAGGSTGGESALLGYGGSRLGIGTDVAGSVRAPAHFGGVYTIKSSMHRFVKTGNATSMAGQEGIPATYSPMASTLEDLETFWRGVMEMKPWTYDHSVLNLPWRETKLGGGGLRWGVLWDDGVVRPTPACARGLRMVTDVLERNGHEVVTLDGPSAYEGLKIGAQLLLADGGRTAAKPMRLGERNDAGMRDAFFVLWLPRWVKRVWGWYLRHVRGDEVSAGLVEVFGEKSVEEYLGLVAQREEYRRRWFEMWDAAGLDFVVTVPNALPAVPHGGMGAGWKACGYTFLFNILDYSAGVMPVTRVDGARDGVGLFDARNGIERANYRMYDAEAMAGLPVGVQVVGRRLEEERVLEAMKLIAALLKHAGHAYDPRVGV